MRRIRVVGLLIGLLAVGLPTLATHVGAQPDVSVFFGNLHSHTALSDGSSTPAEAYERARDVAGLDFLAITDSNRTIRAMWRAVVTSACGSPRAKWYVIGHMMRAWRTLRTERRGARLHRRLRHRAP
jgi:hypothetical protein